MIIKLNDFLVKLAWLLFTIIFIYNPPILHLGYEFIIIIIIGIPFFLKKKLFTYYLLLYEYLKNYVIFFLILITLSLLFIFTNNGQFQFLYSPIKILFSAFGSLVFVVYGFKIFKNKLLVLLFPFIFQLIYIYIGLVDYQNTYGIQKYLHGDNYERFEFNYLGQRGLAFSDSLAFGLAIQLGLYFFFISYMLIENKNKFTFILLSFFSFFPLMSAGRSSFFFFLPLIFLNYKYFIHLFILFTLIILSMFYFDILNFRLFEYAFEIIFSIQNNNNLSMSSTNALVDNMLYKVDLNEWLIGKALYYNSDGSYFGLSDSGYYRFLFFFGYLTSIFLYLTYLFTNYVVLRKLNFPLKFIIPLIGLFFVLHIKGEVINSHSLHTTLFWGLSYFILEKHNLIKT